jgi:DNA polymerase III subunit beta
MKVTILKNKFKKGINVIEKISIKSISLPILNNILISTENSFLNLTATDLEVGIKYWSLAKIKKQGKIAIPSKILSSFINFLPDKPIKLELKGFNLNVESEKHKTIIKGINPDDFPIVPEFSKKEKVKIQSKVLCDGLSRVVDVASSSSIKPEISGIYFLFQKNMLTITATDSFRLAEKKIYLDKSLNNNFNKNYSLIIPQKTAKEIINIFSEKDEVVTIYFSANQILFETFLSETNHPEINLTSKLIEGEFPNYHEIIPKKQTTKIVFPLEEFINQIKLASLFSGKINEIKLKIDSTKKRIDFFSQNPDLGEYQSFINAKIEGVSCQVSFNYRFLLDGLLNLNSLNQKKSEAVLELNGSEKPGVLRLKNEETYLYLIMPIKSS